MLESIFEGIRYLREKPLSIFFLGIIYTTISLIVALFLFNSNASIVILFFTSLTSFYLMYDLIKNEESYDLRLRRESLILKKHTHLIVLFFYLFLGVFTSYLLYGLFLPQDVTDNIFSVQFEAKRSVDQAINGKTIEGRALNGEHFIPITVNNLRVMFFFFLFSFIFGAGAVFLLVYNASIGGVFISQFINEQILHYSGFGAFIFGMVRYFPHAIIEMAGFFMGALAGGILSVALIKHHYRSKHFRTVLLDSSFIIVIAILLIVVAAFVEVFVTGSLVSIFSKMLI